MPRIILKCPYLKGGKVKTAKHLAHLVKYVATRDGVERLSSRIPEPYPGERGKIDDTKKLLPTTQNQQKLIAEILEKFPDAEKMFEYEDYFAKPTIENASEFITQALEQNFETALQLYQKSDAQDFPYASYELAKMYLDGIGTAKDEAKAGEHFKKAFTGFVSLEKKSHDDKLQYRIGQMLLTGQRDVASNFASQSDNAVSFSAADTAWWKNAEGKLDPSSRRAV